MCPALFSGPNVAFAYHVSQVLFRYKVLKARVSATQAGQAPFFVNRATNASAESFNAKTSAFRATLRGVADMMFFMFRLS